MSAAKQWGLSQTSKVSYCVLQYSFGSHMAIWKCLDTKGIQGLCEPFPLILFKDFHAENLVNRKESKSCKFVLPYPVIFNVHHSRPEKLAYGQMLLVLRMAP